MTRRSIYTSTLPIAAALAMLSQPARASQIAYEGFNLTFPAYNTGVGFTGAWATGGFDASASGYTASAGSLSYSRGDDGSNAQGGALLHASGGSISGGRLPPSMARCGVWRRPSEQTTLRFTSAF